MYTSIDTRFNYAKKTAFNDYTSEKRTPYWRYRAILENQHHVDLGEYYTYGIQVAMPDCVKTFHDVSACKETIGRMVDAFNNCQLSPVHLKDAIEDMLP